MYALVCTIITVAKSGLTLFWQCLFMSWITPPNAVNVDTVLQAMPECVGQCQGQSQTFISPVLKANKKKPCTIDGNENIDSENLLNLALKSDIALLVSVIQ